MTEKERKKPREINIETQMVLWKCYIQIQVCACMHVWVYSMFNKYTAKKKN